MAKFDALNLPAEPKADEVVPALTMFDQSPGVDWMLAAMVRMVESDAGITHGVTLVVGGNLLAGTLINGRTYFQELNAQIRQGRDSEAEDLVAETYTSFAGMYPEPSEERPHGPVWNFIHLRRAQIFRAGAPPNPGGGMLWRGKLSAVDGFAFGMLEQTTSD